MKLRHYLVWLSLPYLVACMPTTFSGDAKQTPQQCRMSCVRSGSQMKTFTYVGEYATACSCSPKQASSGEAEAVIAASAGVMTQMRRAQEQQTAHR